MAQIFLTVDRSTLTFDEKLQGKICLSLTEDKSDLTPLCLQIVGKEIHFRRHYLESGQGKGKELLSTKTFLDFTFPVIEFPTNHTLSAGKYEFPFEFSFPEGLPASLRLTSPPTDETFSINYLASAHFLNQATPAPAAMEIWMKASQSAAAALRIPKGWNEYSTPLELPFSYLCCSSGSVRLALQLPRIIVTGKPFDLYYSIENLSKTSDFDVEFALWADLKPKSRMTTLQSVEQVKLFKTKKIPSSQLKVRYQSSRPSSTVKGVEASEIMDSAVLGEMKEGLNQPDHLLRIVLPERYALPGNVIAFGHKGLKEVNYYITFHLTMSGQSEPLKVRAPVTLIQNQSNDAPNKTLTSSASTASNPLLPLFSQPLPEDWTATQTYAVAAVPTPCYSEPVTSFTSKDFSSSAAGEARKFSIAPTSTLTPAGQVSGKVPNISYEGGFADLIYALKLSFQQHRTFLAFLQHSPANAQEIEECSAHDFTMLFQSIRASVDQLLIAEEVAKVKSAISMEHILAAIAACNAEVKIGLAQILATRYTSTGRLDDVLPLQRQCSTYEYLCIEEYYANGRGTAAGAGKAVGKTVGGGSYDTVQSKDDVALTIGAESTEDGMNILKNQSMSMSMSGSMDFDHDHMIQHFDSIQVSRI